MGCTPLAVSSERACPVREGHVRTDPSLPLRCAQGFGSGQALPPIPPIPPAVGFARMAETRPAHQCVVEQAVRFVEQPRRTLDWQESVQPRILGLRAAVGVAWGALRYDG